MISLLGGGGRIDEVVVVAELGMELVGLALEEAVVPIEAAAEWPVCERPRRRTIAGRGEMPLAGGERGEALTLQDLGDRRSFERDRSRHVGESGVEVGDRSHPDRVVVTAGQHRGPGR